MKPSKRKKYSKTTNTSKHLGNTKTIEFQNMFYILDFFKLKLDKEQQALLARTKRTTASRHSHLCF